MRILGRLGAWLAATALAGAVLGTASGAARAQDSEDFQSWNMLIVNRPFSPQFRGYFEIQPRFGDDASRLNTLIIRPAIGYNLRPDTSVWLGYARVTGYQPRQTNEDRLFQQLQITTARPRYTLINRTRLEQRFLENASETSWRARHSVRLFYPLDPKTEWAFVGQEELFINLNSATPALRSGYDQNRTFIGLSRKTSANTRFEFGYQFSHVRVPTAAPDRRIHTILTMFFLNL